MEVSISNNVNHVLDHFIRSSQGLYGYSPQLRLHAHTTYTYLAQIRTISMLQPKYDTCIYSACRFSHPESVVVILRRCLYFYRCEQFLFATEWNSPSQELRHRKIQPTLKWFSPSLPTRPNLRNSRAKRISTANVVYLRHSSAL